MKTDRRDALQLRRLLRSGDLAPVWVPDEVHEALRILVRARADARIDLVLARNRLGKYLLRQGLTAPLGIRVGSLKHTAWLRRLSFRHPADQVVFQDYWRVVTAAASASAGSSWS